MNINGVDLSGPLFDGRAESSIARGVKQARRDVAEHGEQLARSYLMASERTHETGSSVRGIAVINDGRVYQTGRYTMPVTCGPDETVVTSTLASYGPWLEGTGSRNETTRFKGYFSFRRAAQQLNDEAADIAEDSMDPYIREAG